MYILAFDYQSVYNISVVKSATNYKVKNIMQLSYVGNKAGLMEYLHEEAVQSARCLDCLDTGRVTARINTDLEEVKCHCQ